MVSSRLPTRRRPPRPPSVAHSPLVHAHHRPMTQLIIAALFLIECSVTSAYSLMPTPPMRTIAAPLAVPRVPTAKMSIDLSAMYLTALHDHYYPTTCLQALALVSFGDVLAQCIEVSKIPTTLDWQRTLRMGLLGTCIGGLGTATWLRFLENQLPVIEAHAAASFVDLPLWLYEPILRRFELYGPEHNFGLDAVADSLLVVVKASLDAFVWAPVANTLYLALTPLTEGKDLVEARQSLNENFLPVMRSELSTFFPYNLLAFAFIPPLIRPFTTGVVSMCFSTYISFVTHLEPKPQLVIAGVAVNQDTRSLTMNAMAADAARVVETMERIDAASRVVATMDDIDDQWTRFLGDVLEAPDEQ